MTGKTKTEPFPLILFQFLDNSGGIGAGIATLSSIIEPNTPMGFQECIQSVNSWIADQTELSVQWPVTNKTNWNLKIYKPDKETLTTPDAAVDECKAAKALMMSYDKDELKKQLQLFLKSQPVVQNLGNKPADNSAGTSTAAPTVSAESVKNKSKTKKAAATKETSLPITTPISKNGPSAKNGDGQERKTRSSRRHLDFKTVQENSTRAEDLERSNVETSSSVKISDSEYLTIRGEVAAGVKRCLELENENTELSRKVSKLEVSLNESIEERKILEGQLAELEADLDSVARDRSKKDTEISELNATLERMHADQLLPEKLSRKIDNLITVIQTDAKNREEAQKKIIPVSNLTPSSSPNVTPKKNMYKLDGNVMIDSNALKNAIAYGSTGNTDHNLNLMINTILEALLKPNELANFSLSGRPCPNMQGSTAKPKFPGEIMTALKNYIRKMWKIWYNTIPSDKAIKDGVGAKLRSCHTTIKKLNKKVANVTLPETTNEDRNAVDERIEEQIIYRPKEGENDRENDDESSSSSNCANNSSDEGEDSDADY